MNGQTAAVEAHVGLAGVFSKDQCDRNVQPARPNHTEGSAEGLKRKPSSHDFSKAFS